MADSVYAQSFDTNCVSTRKATYRILDAAKSNLKKFARSNKLAAAAPMKLFLAKVHHSVSIEFQIGFSYFAVGLNEHPKQ